MLWLVCYNPEIDWNTEEIMIMKYLEKCERQQRPKQEKLEQQKQNKEEKREEGKKQEEKEQKKKEKKKKKPKKIKEEAKKLVSQRFYKQIHIFRKKTSEKILMKKL